MRDAICLDRCCDGAEMEEIRLSLRAGDIDRLVIVGCSGRRRDSQLYIGDDQLVLLLSEKQKEEIERNDMSYEGTRIGIEVSTRTIQYVPY